MGVGEGEGETIDFEAVCIIGQCFDTNRILDRFSLEEEDCTLHSRSFIPMHTASDEDVRSSFHPPLHLYSIEWVLLRVVFERAVP